MDKTGRKITKIAREAAKLVNKTLLGSGVGASEIDFIHAVRHAPGITQAQLCKILSSDKGATARRAAALERKGYITRVPSTSDRRSMTLFATKKAQELKDSKSDIESDFYEWLTDGTDKDELDTFLKVLDKLYIKSKQESRAGFPDILRGKKDSI